MTEPQPQPQEANRPLSPPAETNYDSVLRSPAHLLASIPGALGYYPNEAIVLINFRNDTENPEYLDVGPYMCTDLGSSAGVSDMLKRLPLPEHQACFAVIVSRVPQSMMVSRAIEMLHECRDNFGPLIDACWYASEITDGTHFEFVFGPSEEEAGDYGWDSASMSGTVASVIGSPAMEPLLANGALPELDRADTFRHFDPVSLEDLDTCELIAAGAYRRGTELLDLTLVAPALAKAEVERACDLFTVAPSVNLIDTDGCLVIDDLFDDDNDIELLAALLSRNRLRDFLILDALEHPRAAAALLLTIARNFAGPIRANALSLWAMVAVNRRLYPWAGAALKCAQEEVPGHNLSHLLSQCMAVGKLKELVDAMRSGSHNTWSDFGR